MLWFRLSLHESASSKCDLLPGTLTKCSVLTAFLGCSSRPAVLAISPLTFENPSSISNRSATNSIYCFIRVQFIPIRPTGNASVRNSWKLKYRWHLEKCNLRWEKERRHLCFTATQFVIFKAPLAIV